MLTVISHTLLFLLLSAAPQGTVASGDLERKIAAVLPTQAEERFSLVPWQQSLMAARVVSAQRGRPMFLWIMNGHPFGCT